MNVDPRPSDRHDLTAQDRDVLEALERARAQYHVYLELTEISGLAGLATPAVSEAPPRTDLPLTLTVG